MIARLILCLSVLSLLSACGSSGAPSNTKAGPKGPSKTGSEPDPAFTPGAVAQERQERANSNLPQPEFEWSPQEVLMLQLVNRLRKDPRAEEQRTGEDIDSGYTDEAITRIGPRPPLALEASLTRAARTHSQNMHEQNFFAHRDPNGAGPTDRAQAQGYTGLCGENIAAGQTDTEGAYRAWLRSPGHRANMMSLSILYQEFGYGEVTDPYFPMYTQVFGSNFSSPKKYILGVIYDDRNRDDFYGIDEGVNFIEVKLSAGGQSVTSHTGLAGYFVLDVSGLSGAYRLDFKDLLDEKATSRSGTLGDENVQVDVKFQSFE